MKKVLVCCANGVATSNFLKVKLQSRLRQEGIEAEIATCTTLEVVNKSNTMKPDLIISTAGLRIGTDEKFPVVYGVSILSGIGAEKVWEEVLGILKK